MRGEFNARRRGRRRWGAPAGRWPALVHMQTGARPYIDRHRCISALAPVRLITSSAAWHTMSAFGVFTAPTYEGAVRSMVAQCVLIAALAAHMSWTFRRPRDLARSMTVAGVGCFAGLLALAVVRWWGLGSRSREYQALYLGAGREEFLLAEFVTFARWSLAAATVGLIAAWLVLKVRCRRSRELTGVGRAEPTVAPERKKRRKKRVPCSKEMSGNLRTVYATARNGFI